MKHKMSLLLFVVMALLMILPAFAEEAYYARTNKKNVNIRVEPDTGSKLVIQIKTKGTKLAVISTVEDKKGNRWCEVETQLGKKGYIQESLLTRTNEKAVVKVNGQYTSWSDAYYDFILGGKYMNWRGPGLGKEEKFYEDSYMPVQFGLYDMNRDGIPELLAGGNGAMADNCYHVFTYVNGKLQFCGNVGFRECRIWVVSDSNYPGVFCHEGKDDISVTIYYTLINNNTIIKEPVWKWEYKFILREDETIDISAPPVSLTKNMDLYRVAFSHDIWKLLRYTRKQIQSMGWDAFLSSKFFEYWYIDEWLQPYFEIGF